MKKLIYSTLGLILLGSLILSSCKKDDNTTTTPTTPETPKPIITFVNTLGYTFANGSAVNVLPESALLFGMKVSSTIDIKSVSVTRSYQGGAAKPIFSKTLASGIATYVTDIFDTLPVNYKGAYVYTFTSTDKDLSVGTSTITITATGALTEIAAEQVWSKKSTTHASENAYDMANNIAVASTGNPLALDIVDQSTASVIAKSWAVGAGNTTLFIPAPFDKAYTQLKTELDIKALWDKNASRATNKLTGMVGGIGAMVLVKVSRTATPVYYVMTIDDIVDGAGADDDYTLFTYKY